jgi:hypothetical protein
MRILWRRCGNRKISLNPFFLSARTLIATTIFSVVFLPKPLNTNTDSIFHKGFCPHILIKFLALLSVLSFSSEAVSLFHFFFSVDFFQRFYFLLYSLLISLDLDSSVFLTLSRFGFFDMASSRIVSANSP